MSVFPSFRAIRRRVLLFGGALVLTQLPAFALLMLDGRLAPLALMAYALASVAAAGGLFAIGLAWWSRIQRIVALVRGYAEHGLLPAAGTAQDQGSIELVQASLANLDRVVRSLENEATRDPLTGIYNRRNCSQRLEADLHRSARSGTPFSLALFDLDELKAINDRYGHVAGDEALRHLARVLQEGTREGDWVARWGGDEFLLGLWNADRDEAATAAQRVLTRLAGEEFTLDEHRIAVGASVGVAQATTDEDAGGLFARADQALIECKRDGRGRVGLS